MFKRFLSFFLLPALLLAQAPKVVPITRAGKGAQLTTVEGDKNFTDLSAAANASQRAWGQKDSTTTGLTLGYYGGPAFNGSAWTTASDGTVALTASSTNYVERTLAGVVSANTAGWSPGKIPLAQVTTGSSSITTALDFRQGVVAEAQIFRHTMQNAVGRSMAQRAADWVSVKDWGAKGDGTTDDTTAIQTALDAAFAISQGTVTDDFGVRHTGAVTIFFPPGKYIANAATLETYQNVKIQGAGRYSTIISSSYNGTILRNKMPGAEYGPSGIVIEDLTIQGDRTKANQIGIALLRAYFPRLSNVTVQECGSDGIHLYQVGLHRLDNVDCHKNVGYGLCLDSGMNSWSDLTPVNNPTIGGMSVNSHYGFNDKAGIRLQGYHDSNIFNGGSAEQNNQSTPSVGYQIETVGVSVTPDEFVDMHCESTNGAAHVYVNLSSVSTIVRFTRFRHLPSGTTLDRSAIVVQGTLILDQPYGTPGGYKNIGGSTVPFRLTKATAKIRLYEPLGNSITNGIWVEDETNATTGLSANLVYTSGERSNTPHTRVTASGGETQLYQVETEAYPWAAMESFYRSLTLSGGYADKSAIGARLSWLVSKGMGIADGHHFVPGWVSADRGDTSPTLTVGTDRSIQQFKTPLTANRTVTLSTSGAVNGDWFRIVRTGLGSFTLAVGALKTIPSGTAAFVEVAFDGTAWQLVGYGTL